MAKTKRPGRRWLMASLMYGTGLRLMECLRLRVQDIDFTRNETTVGRLVFEVLWMRS